jgi:hypothetical protein
LIQAFIFTALIAFSAPGFAFDHKHTAWTQVLNANLNSQGLFNYKKLKAEIKADQNHAFAKYISAIQKVTLAEYERFSTPEQLAFLINSYNALTVKLILDHYPIKSIKDTGRLFKKPWGIKFFKLLDGKIEALDPIEHDWIRPKFKDYRIHAAVNCASISCPPLRKSAYTADQLSKQLDEQMSLWLQDGSRNQIDTPRQRLKLSKIFDWYEKDFIEWGGGVHAVVAKHLKPKTEISTFEIEYLDYDWNLNEGQ